MSTTHAALEPLAHSSPHTARLSAPVYFSCVALLTALGFGATAMLRPALGHAMREWVGLEKPPHAVPGSFYSVRVAPLLEDHCVGCHGARRQKAKLRLDSFATLMRGGKHGAVVRSGDLKGSELITRIGLPAAAEKVMPPNSKTPLTADEITVIKLWVAAGASGVQPVGAIRGAPQPVVEVKFPEIDAATVHQQRAALAATVRQLQARFPNTIGYESRGSADLQVNASLLGPSFGDAQLAELAPLREHIVWIDLSGTGITDAAAAALAAMGHLRVLRLANTKVTDRTLATLATLAHLKSLTVVGVPATDASLGPLRSRGVKIYDGK
jgi:hypothetical protein